MVNITQSASAGIPQLTIPSLKSFMRAFVIERKRPLLIQGAPGIGKTVAVMQLAKEIGAYLCDIRLSLYDSVDFRGIPSLQEIILAAKGRKAAEATGKHLTVWNLPATMPFKGNPNFPTDRPILLFLDELGSAAAAVFPVAMQLINEGRVGEHELMDNVVIVAATNRASDRGTSVVLPTTVNNRFLHVEAIPDRVAWCEWWTELGGTPMAVAFYEWKKDLFFTFNPKDRDRPAFATPRTNQMAWEIYMDDALSWDMKQYGIMSAVGEGVGLQIIGFHDVWTQVIKTRDVLADPVNCPVSREESMMYATAVSLSGDMTVKNVGAIDTYLKRLPTLYQTLAWTLALKRTNGLHADDLAFTDQAMDYTRRNLAVF